MLSGAKVAVLSRPPRQPISEILTRLDLRTGLKVCLDAGDNLSYTSGQSWLDRSGNGYDFFLGLDGSATSTDPTFNGIPGRKSKDEYWSFDGGDGFTYDSANEAWMENMHKADAKYSIASWFFYGSTPAATSTFVGTSHASTAAGFRFSSSSTGTLSLTVGSGSGTVMSRAGGSLSTSPGAGKWGFVAASVDASVGANGCILMRNTNVTLGDSTYTTPTSGSAANVLKIGASSSGTLTSTFPSDWLLASMMIWEGTALTAAQLRSLYDATYLRFQ